MEVRWRRYVLLDARYLICMTIDCKPSIKKKLFNIILHICTKVYVKSQGTLCKTPVPFPKFSSDWYNFFRVLSKDYVRHFQNVFAEKKWNYHRENEDENFATHEYLFCTEKTHCYNPWSLILHSWRFCNSDHNTSPVMTLNVHPSQ